MFTNEDVIAEVNKKVCLTFTARRAAALPLYEQDTTHESSWQKEALAQRGFSHQRLVTREWRMWGHVMFSTARLVLTHTGGRNRTNHPDLEVLVSRVDSGGDNEMKEEENEKKILLFLLANNLYNCSTLQCLHILWHNPNKTGCFSWLKTLSPDLICWLNLKIKHRKSSIPKRRTTACLALSSISAGVNVITRLTSGLSRTGAPRP